MGKAPKISVPQPLAPTAAETRAIAESGALRTLAAQEEGITFETGPDGQLRAVRRPKTQEETEREGREKELETLAFNRLKGVADPETKRLVGETFASQRELGDESISQFLTETAGQRGLDLKDTPFLREAGLAKGRLELGLRGAEAGALLDVGNRQQLFGQALREFSEDLRQRAYQNKLLLSGQGSQTGIGLGNVRASLFRPMATGGGGGGGFLGSAGGILGGAGGFLAGASKVPWGSLAGLFGS